MVTVERDRLSKEVVRLSGEKATLEAMQGMQNTHGELSDEIARLMSLLEVEAARADEAVGREAEALAKGTEERMKLFEELGDVRQQVNVL